MEKRIFIAVLVSFAILFLYGQLAPRLFPQYAAKKPPVTTSATATTTATSTEPAAPPSASTAAPTSAPTPAAIASAPVIPAANISASSVQTTTVEAPDFVAVFSNRGAELTSFKLKKYKGQSGALVELVKSRPAGSTDFPFAIEATDARVTRVLDSALWAVTETTGDHGDRVIEYRYSGNGVVATKTFRIGSDYQFHFATSLAPVIPYRVVIGPGIRTLDASEGSSQLTITGNGVMQRDDKLELIKKEKAGAFTPYPADVQYVGIEDNYFISVLKPEKANGAVIKRVDVHGAKKEDTHRELYAGLNATTDGVVSGYAIFAPKETGIADRLGLERTLQFGRFGFIARILLEALKWINQYTHNWGWAIVVLTVLLKLLLYPLQHKSMTSMRRMQQLQPKVEAIKARYKKAKTDPDQRQKMNMEVMKLYQAEGVNPMGGCVPMLLQLPIFWGFYGLLSNTIELRGAPFILWIHDLSAKDPYYITPILMTVAMFVQQTITPTTVDAAQRRMFMIMPLVMGLIFKELPVGLVIYWLVQNVLTIVQQLILNKWWNDHPQSQS